MNNFILRKLGLLLVFSVFFALCILNGQVKIGIDPGHGFATTQENPNWPSREYNGATVWSPDGKCTVETENVLAVGILVKDKLESYCSNVEVYMTRDENVENDLLGPHARADWANDLDLDLFFSIHTNASGNECLGNTNAHGTEIYACHRHQACKNSCPIVANPTLEIDKDFGEVMLEKLVEQDLYDRQSGEIEDWHDLYNTDFHLPVLRRNKAEAKVYSELGYHTNSNERARLSDSYWQERYAEAYFQAIVEYLGNDIDCVDCTDEYEPANNELETAPDLVVSNQSSVPLINGMLDYIDQDVDLYKFIVITAGVYEVNLTGLSSFYSMEVINDDEVVIVSEINGDGGISFSAGEGQANEHPKGIPFYVRISAIGSIPEGCVPYTLTASLDTQTGVVQDVTKHKGGLFSSLATPRASAAGLDEQTQGSRTTVLAPANTNVVITDEIASDLPSGTSLKLYDGQGNTMTESFPYNVVVPSTGSTRYTMGAYYNDENYRSQYLMITANDDDTDVCEDITLTAPFITEASLAPTSSGFVGLVSCSDVAGVESYEFKVRESGGSTVATTINTNPTGILQPLYYGNDYEFRVRVEDTNGCKSDWSSWYLLESTSVNPNYNLTMTINSVEDNDPPVGGDTDITMTICNPGGVATPASELFMASIHISEDQTLSSDDWYADDLETFDGLAAGECETFTLDAEMPDDLAAGSYLSLIHI